MGRRRPFIQWLGPIRISSALLSGVVLTVGTSWWIAISPMILPKFPFSRNMEQLNRPEFLISIPVEEYWLHRDGNHAELTIWSDTGVTVYSETMLADESDLDWIASDPDRFRQRPIRPSWVGGWEIVRRRFSKIEPERLNEIAHGWPRVAIAHRMIDDGLPVKFFDCWRLPRSWESHLKTTGPGLPLSPVLSGFVFNTIVYAAPVYAVLSIPQWLTALRRRLTNRCPACGYSLEGLAADACPECGRPKKAKPRQ